MRLIALAPLVLAACQAASAGGGTPSPALIDYCLKRLDRTTPPGPETSEAERFGYEFCLQENRPRL